ARHLHALDAPPVAVAHAKRKPERKNVEPEERRHRKSAPAQEDERKREVYGDDDDQHQLVGAGAEAPVRTQLGVHEERAIERRRRGRAFPSRRHRPKTSAATRAAKGPMPKRLTKAKAEALYA